MPFLIMHNAYEIEIGNEHGKRDANIFHGRHNKFAFGDKFFLMGVFVPLKVRATMAKRNYIIIFYLFRRNGKVHQTHTEVT